MPITSRQGIDWEEEQRRRLARYDVTESADVHCHCLPGLDDGPEQICEALQLCRALVCDGLTTVVATPHQLGRYREANSARLIRERVAELNAALRQATIPLNILPGAEVRVDGDLLRLIDEDQVMTVADSRRYILLELPHRPFLDPTKLIEQLVAKGITPVMTHPERDHHVLGQPHVVIGWVERGAILQVTAASLVGGFGDAASQLAWQLVAKGWASVVATDAHSLYARRPRMTDALRAIEEQVGKRTARNLCIDNPACIIRGQPIPPAP